jgi:hypothetical protein
MVTAFDAGGNWLRVDVKGHGQKYVPKVKDKEELFKFIGGFNYQSASEGIVVAQTGVDTGRLLMSITISGASGAHSSFVNGVYDETHELSCGQHVYVKRSDPQVCIHFWLLTCSWVVSEVENKGKNDKCKAYLKLEHAGCLSSASRLRAWCVLSDGGFVSQLDVRCSVAIGGFEGGLKKTDDDVWLEYRGGKLVVCDVRDRRQGKGYIYCDAELPYDSDFCHNFNGFHLLYNLLHSKNLWYSITGSSFLPGCTFHPQLRTTCLPSLPFTGVYGATRSIIDGMPVFVSDGCDPHTMEYNEHDACWLIKRRYLSQICAISCAVSEGFPAPVLWSSVQLSHSQSFLPPIHISGAPQCDINGIYLPVTGGFKSTAVWARQLRSGASLEFCTEQKKWALKSAAHGPCHYFRPNTPPLPSASSGLSEPGNCSIQCGGLASGPAYSEEFPDFADGVWESLAHSLSSLTCRVLQVGVRPISSVISFDWKRLDFTSQCFCEFPSSLFAISIAPHANSSLCEGTYKLFDTAPNKSASALQLTYINADLGQQLLFVISSMQIELVRLKFENDLLFEGKPRACQKSQSPLPFSDPQFSIDLYPTPRAANDRPALRVQLTSLLPKDIKSKVSPGKPLVQPHLTPMFTDPACIVAVRHLIANPAFDTRAFWQRCFAQINGDVQCADSSALHRFLVCFARQYVVHHLLTMLFSGVFPNSLF